MPDADDAQPANGPDVARLLERVEAEILGGPRRYTPAEISERAGVEREEARRLWRALGFPTIDEADVVFTDGDVAALRAIGELTTYGFADEELRLAVARLFGQTFSRLASYQGQLLLDRAAERPELLGSEEQLADLVAGVVPLLERLQGYAWRRQLAAYVARMAAQGSDQLASSPTTLAVGFVDMSGFTSLTKKATEAELRALLDAFETSATEIVGQHGGRIVKTLGDEVLFHAGDPAEAAEIALELLEAAAADQHLPDLRAGIAFGPVVSRLGDVYGSTVNIASRLTSIGRAGSVLVDRQMRDALDGDARFRLRARRPESVRGYHRLHSWRLRRADG
ncbi:MAG TPA: adenylate/guanylate cyclase domain-containing protein [Jatrophihabitans sp.]|nr:adenylate/guanylate cyclase domain-containing protein [Jatrophihabitans sp.]